MNKRKSTKRALLMSALSLLLCVSMLVGSTFAWFTDSVTSGRNNIQSGNLDVKLEYRVKENGTWGAWAEVTSTTKIFNEDKVEPGFVSVAQFRITNQGSLALKYQLAADVYAETAGKNQEGATFLLSDYIKTAVVAENATRDEILDLAGAPLKASYSVNKGSLAANDTAVVAMAIWMPTTVGNVANHDGTNVPSIEFGINLIATQDAVEADAFGKDYDEQATYPSIDLPAVLTAGAVVDDTTTLYELPLMSDENGKQGSVIVPKEALDPAAEDIEVVVKKLPVVDSTVPVGQNQTATTLDVTVTGIKEGNTTPIEVTVNAGPNLGTVKLYHKNVDITSSIVSYSNTTGVLIFRTTSFSPFTIVYDGQEPEYDDNTTPNADVTDITANFGAEFDWEAAWETGKLLAPIGTQPLNAVFEFKAPHTSETISECAYKEWECDYYVMLKSDTLTTLPEEYIALGGNYGNWGWNGFFNPEVDANVEIPLLGSVTENAWTYEGVVNLVSTFQCGVGVNEAKAGDALDGSQFIVMLRLTNPETREYVNVATVTYDFATNTSTVTESVELQPAN